MSRRKEIKNRIGILLGAALIAGGTGTAAFAEDFSSESVLVDVSNIADFETVENGTGQEEQQEITELPQEESLDGQSVEEVTVSDELPEDESTDVLSVGDLIREDTLETEILENLKAAIRELTYTGEAQELLAPAGILEDDRYYYSLDGETYEEAIPVGTNAGEYTVYVKPGNGTEAYKLVVTIAKADVVFTPPVAVN